MKISGAVLVLGVALSALVWAVWTGPAVTAGAMSVVAVLFAYAWPYLLGIPAKRMISTVGAVFSVAAITSPLYAPADSMLKYVPAFIGFGVAASFVVQLLRGTGQVRRLESLIGLSAALLIAGMGAGWVAVARYAPFQSSQQIIEQATRGQGAVICVAVSAVVGSLIPLIQPRVLSSTPVVIVGVGLFFGILTGATTELPMPSSVVIGTVTGTLIGAFLSLTRDRSFAMTKRTALASGLSPVGILGVIAFYGATFS